MAEVKSNIIKHLMNDASVFAVFGNRITGDDVPDGQTYPYAYLWIVTSPQQYHHGGDSVRTVLVQCDVISDTITGADDGAQLIKTSLSGFRGQMGSMNVGYCFVNFRDVPKDPDQRAYRRIIEIEIGTNN